MQAAQVADRLREWLGRTVHIHLEVNPGAYWRNGSATLTEAHIKGTGPYRVFLELDEKRGLIQIDGVTHMSLEGNLVICTAYDDQHRLARTLEVSLSSLDL